ncbi:DNA alkylation repair protein [Frigidibacter sp. RF13]|uniref:DNA alkylation repair protein n=1 Tax=Frigidibacter sp. RF13 TaxID=2997340 RepID=UPI00226E2A73|nr:DNA alkylation repair protein [Frigidibacter sp. RF13]MCY1127590.1 DNA alkylation repair protein [Frigidibacter sp. RF13]
MADNPRKGAARIADVPPGVLADLNAGRIEAATLSENLATDFGLLLSHVLPDLASRAHEIDPRAGVTRRMAMVADLVLAGDAENRIAHLARHPSDLARGWATFALAALPGLPLADRLSRIRPFADDPHFGVREWAWLALRPHVVEAPGEAIELLTPWASDPSANIRRFAIEATRPRGVWCAHIAALKSDPEPGRALLGHVRADPSRYVQDSTANWLNDAWKSRPDWVEALCSSWTAESPGPATAYIVRRALRNRPTA